MRNLLPLCISAQLRGERAPQDTGIEMQNALRLTSMCISAFCQKSSGRDRTRSALTTNSAWLDGSPMNSGSSPSHFCGCRKPFQLMAGFGTPGIEPPPAAGIDAGVAAHPVLPLARLHPITKLRGWQRCHKRCQLNTHIRPYLKVALSVRRIYPAEMPAWLDMIVEKQPCLKVALPMRRDDPAGEARPGRPGPVAPQPVVVWVVHRHLLFNQGTYEIRCASAIAKGA